MYIDVFPAKELEALTGDRRTLSLSQHLSHASQARELLLTSAA